MFQDNALPLADSFLFTEAFYMHYLVSKQMAWWFMSFLTGFNNPSKLGTPCLEHLIVYYLVSQGQFYILSSHLPVPVIFSLINVIISNLSSWQLVTKGFCFFFLKCSEYWHRFVAITLYVFFFLIHTEKETSGIYYSSTVWKIATTSNSNIS